MEMQLSDVRISRWYVVFFLPCLMCWQSDAEMHHEHQASSTLHGSIDELATWESLGKTTNPVEINVKKLTRAQGAFKGSDLAAARKRMLQRRANSVA